MFDWAKQSAELAISNLTAATTPTEVGKLSREIRAKQALPCPELHACQNDSETCPMNQFTTTTTCIPCGDDCLCRIIPVLGDSSPLEYLEQGFDAFQFFIKDLYDTRAANTSCGALVDELCDITQRSKLEILDVGCGMAPGAAEIMKKGHKFVGVDISKKMIDSAIQHFSPHKDFQDTNSKFLRCDCIPYLMGIEDKSHGDNIKIKRNQKFDIIACQGNTFDYFLGPVQKALALKLFVRRLKPGGVLLFSGEFFEPKKQRIFRKLEGYDIVYIIDPIGKYIHLEAKTAGKSIGKVVLHPTDWNWLDKAADSLELEALPIGTGWFGPKGAKSDYELRVYRKS